MDTRDDGKLQQSVILIADIMEEHPVKDTAFQRTLELSEPETVNTLIQTIRSLGRDVTHYSSPEELATNAARHKSDIVLSIFGGTVSRNRMALIPAICEAFNLKFVGPDVYGRIIAQDKEVSKRLARDCGLRTPAWRIARHRDELKRLGGLSFPCVIKPLHEGSSIGISDRNLVHSFEDAKKVAAHLIESVDQPVLLEEFVPGKESAFVAIEDEKELHWGYTEVVVEEKPEYFNNRLFDAQEKAHPTPGRTVKNIDTDLSASDLLGIKSLLSAYGQFGYCRVDGRHYDGQFHFLELTPDAWINPKGQFAMGFTQKGWTYEQVIERVLLSAR